MHPLLFYILQSSLPIPPISGLTKKRWYSETGGERSEESYITKKNHISDLKMGGGMGGGGGVPAKTFARIDRNEI